jgi:hypothetical protein
MVAHACNSSYSGGVYQEDHNSRPAQANSSQDPISKTAEQNRLEVWLKWYSTCFASVKQNSNLNFTHIHTHKSLLLTMASRSGLAV